MKDDRQDLGLWGEAVVVRFLEQQGFSVEERRYRAAGGEVDLVARDSDGLVFVEVKTRRARGCGHGIEAVTLAKRRSICKAATVYLMRHAWGQPGRFAVAQVERTREGLVVVWFDNAFDEPR